MCDGSSATTVTSYGLSDWSSMSGGTIIVIFTTSSKQTA
jgi:hypothetical protein